MKSLFYAFLFALLVLAASASAEEPENPDFPKCNPSDENACGGHGKCLDTGECECESMYTGVSCQCGGTESECTADARSGCTWCSSIEPAVCLISEEVCHALSIPMADAETGEGSLTDRSSVESINGDSGSSSTKSNSLYFFIGSVLAIGAFAWYFKLRGVSAPIVDDMPPFRQRTSNSAFEMQGDGL
jgi:hypothetical protein